MNSSSIHGNIAAAIYMGRVYKIKKNNNDKTQGEGKN
jgi:hypothetical protein